MALPPQLIDSDTQLTNQKIINSVQYTGYYANLTGVEEGEIHVELNKLISNHTVLSYTETWNHLKEIDRSIDDATKIDLFYTGRSHPNTDSDWEQNPIRSDDSWNREHIWPRSHGGFDPETKSNVAGTDLHNLRPTDKSVNSARGNKDLDMLQPSMMNVLSVISLTITGSHLIQLKEILQEHYFTWMSDMKEC